MKYGLRIYVIILVLAAIAGLVWIFPKGSGGGETVYDSGIWGIAKIGPVCPVQRIPPDPKCAPRPFQAKLYIARQNSLAHETVQTNSDGSFRIHLSPGIFVISNDITAPMPILTSITVQVDQNQWVEVNPIFDSGIR